MRSFGAQGTISQPLVLSDFEHQRFFAHAGGRVFFAQRSNESVKTLFAFVFEDAEGAREAVDEVVQARDGATLLGLGPVLSCAFARRFRVRHSRQGVACRRRRREVP